MPKVVVVGSANTDMILRVPHIPAPGETVLGGEFRTAGGGKGANQAVAAARAGGTALLVGAVGTDALGNATLEALVREGIDVGLVRTVPGTPSGVALILVDDRGENSIAVAPGANGTLRPDDVAPLAELLAPGDVVLLQLEVPIETVEAAAGLGAERGARVLLNPAPARPLPDSLLSAVSCVTPNELEAEALTGVPVRDEDGLRRAATMLHERGVRDVLITLGARGAYLSSRAGAGILEGFAVQAVDTTAAGDVFSGALAVALVEGKAMREAVRFAHAAAALSVTTPGAQPSIPRRDEIETFLAGHGGASQTAEAGPICNE